MLESPSKLIPSTQRETRGFDGWAEFVTLLATRMT